MSANAVTLYIKGDRDVEVTKPDVTLGDILSIECTNRAVLARVRALKIVKMKKTGQQRCVVSILRVIECIHEVYPEAEVQNLGETDIIITYEDQKTPAFFWHILKAVFVAVVTFFGSAFSIMAFNNDVDVTKLFDQIHELVTGTPSDGFTVLEISYSIGLTAGILIFFNHFGKKRFTVDPTPMEVQMRLYENDIQTTLIEDSARKGEEIDVGMGSTVPPGSDRN
ncbi:stage V sporulation protein AA [Lachnoclostridium sp. An169]|uniref:stage V sporulation protein AA n=1 Tax=Lachnoclostridium sp. An169 TaxID=1965569 RepID=UPI000B39E52A|nr:stage V sporulation protein AA [Lachnoclostridium sp. An169]OUP82413.1 stage V sporulation protein AA [Lachnoclostridium sp. An169]HJA67070.1 stage V sporulation protein AA [Candidatus Mediterraneibacter cottocaccae]